MANEASKYETLAEFELHEVLPHVINKRKKIKRDFVADDGTVHPVKITSQRLILFKEKGTTCVRCGLQGTKIRLQRFKGGSSDAPRPILISGARKMTAGFSSPKITSSRDPRVARTSLTITKQCALPATLEKEIEHVYLTLN